MPARSGPVRISDPRAIRALAHPARLAIIEALYAGERLTATQCAELTGLSPSATSYHLRALEKWGLVRRAPATTDGRERPWEAAGTELVVSSGSEAANVADAALVSTVLDRDRQELARFVAGQADESPEWRDAPTTSTSRIWLTAPEVRELIDGWRAQLERYRDRSSPAARPEGARPVRLTTLAIPARRPSR